MPEPDPTAIPGDIESAHRRLTIVRLLSVIEQIDTRRIDDPVAGRLRAHVEALEGLGRGALEAASRLPATHAWVTTGERLLRNGAYERYQGAHPARHVDALGALVLGLSQFAPSGARGMVRLRGEHRLAVGMADLELVVPPEHRLAEVAWLRTATGLELHANGVPIGQAMVDGGMVRRSGWWFERPAHAGNVVIRCDNGDRPPSDTTRVLTAAIAGLRSVGSIAEVVIDRRPAPWVAGRIVLDPLHASPEHKQALVDRIHDDSRNRAEELRDWTRSTERETGDDALDLSDVLVAAGARPDLLSQWPVRLRKTRAGVLRPLDWSSLDVMVELPNDVVSRLAAPTRDWPDEAAAWAGAAAAYIAGSFARCLDALAVCRHHDTDVEEHRYLAAFAHRHLGHTAVADDLLFSST